MKLKEAYRLNVEYLNHKLDVENNFDVCNRSFILGNRECTFYFIDGFVKDEI